jgi:hypothetical protein
METNKDLGDKTWNNQQKPETHELNEGFSSENLPENYNNDAGKRMKNEIETDQFGYQKEVMRARFPHQHDEIIDYHDNAEAIENKKSLENRDRNYDIEANRYPYSHPDNHKNRGNIDLGK